MKLCVDCIHHREFTHGGPHGGHMCKHPESDAWKISPVTGVMGAQCSSSWDANCEINRMSKYTCGIEGKMFESVPVPTTWWKRFIAHINKPATSMGPQ